MNDSDNAGGSARMEDGDQPIVVHAQVHGRSATLENPGELPVVGLNVVDSSLAAPAESPRLTASGIAERALSLDGLRGLFIVLMTVSFTVSWPFFPHWMYHRQFPPPDETLAPIVGLTWPDLVFPGFLFTMAAAIPFALSRRIERGETELGLLFMTIRRVLLLYVFALFIAHSDTYFTGYTQEGRAVGILGFFILFFIFLRRREDWDERKFRFINRLAWVAGIIFLFLAPSVYGKSFSLLRADDIITSIAYAVFAGSIVWYFTRDNIPARLLVLGAVVATYLGSRGDGWLQETWWNSQVPDFMEPAQLKFLIVAIPGTIAGDFMLRSSRGFENVRSSAWSALRIGALTLLGVLFVPVAVIGLYIRALNATTLTTFALLAVGCFLVYRPSSAPERLLQQLFRLSAYCLLIGFFVEPFEGGISKVPDTLSYYFITTGLSGMLLMSLTAIIDVFDRKGLSGPLIDVGQNAMLGYVIFTLFLNPFFEMIPALRPLLTSTPGEASLRILLSTVLVVLIVRALTRHRVFWKT